MVLIYVSDGSFGEVTATGCRDAEMCKGWTAFRSTSRTERIADAKNESPSGGGASREKGTADTERGSLNDGGASMLRETKVHGKYVNLRKMEMFLNHEFGDAYQVKVCRFLVFCKVTLLTCPAYTI